MYCTYTALPGTSKVPQSCHIQTNHFVAYLITNASMHQSMLAHSHFILVFLFVCLFTSKLVFYRSLMFSVFIWRLIIRPFTLYYRCPKVILCQVTQSLDSDFHSISFLDS